jgi:hypothetical protein
VCLAEATIALCVVMGPAWLLTAIIPGRLGLIPFVAGLGLAVPTVRRGFRVSLEITDREVVISNYWFQYRLQWDEIEHIFMGIDVLGLVPLRAISFRRRGRWRPVPATASTAAGSNRAEMARELERHARSQGVRFSIDPSAL